MTRQEFEAAVGRPLVGFARQCHAAALALVCSGALGDDARVARGFCEGVSGQHSWVVLGGDCYDPKAAVVDPTLWSYDLRVKGVWSGPTFVRPHVPHQAGSIWDYGRPAAPVGEPVVLDVEWSREARIFLDVVGPLDRRGWSVLAHAPVGDWPASEILGAMWDDDRVSALVPIDVIGMLTDKNPGGLYLPSPSDAATTAKGLEPSV